MLEVAVEERAAQTTQKLQARVVTVAAVQAEILLAKELLQLQEQQTQAVVVVVFMIMTHQVLVVQE